MDQFFTPRCLTIVGASNSQQKLGYRVMQRLLLGKAQKIIPIHARESKILDVPTCTDLASVQEHIDLLVALVPSERLLPIIESAREGQVSYLLAISSGFAEVSSEGRRLQHDVVGAATRRGIRIVGPNSMGMLNASYCLNASLVPDAPPGGAGLSCLTQSGGFGIAASMYALDHQLPIAKICDLGNTSDVQITEVLDYFGKDTETLVVGLYLEALGDIDALVDAVSNLAKIKPVVLTTPGRTEAGMRASLAHLGLPTAASRDALSASGAPIHASTGRELLNIAKALCWQPPCRGTRVAILTATGGIGAELADLCTDAGMEVPELSAATKLELRSLLPPFAAVGNPIDVTPIYWQFAQVYPAVMHVLLAAEEIDLLIIAITDVATGIEQLATAIVEQLRSTNVERKPCYVFWGSRDDALVNMRVLESAQLPCYRSTSETVSAASAHASRIGVRSAMARSSDS